MIEIGKILACRTTGKKVVVTGIHGTSLSIVAIDKLERADPNDPMNGNWAPFVPEKEATHGQIKMSVLLTGWF